MPGGVAPKFGSEKGVALHGGVAATVAGVAPHCATKDKPFKHELLQKPAGVPPRVYARKSFLR